MLDDDEPFNDFFPATGVDELTYYNEDDVVDADRWRELTSPAKIGYIEPEFIAEFEKEEKPSDKAPWQTSRVVFNPKFRLVVGSEGQRGFIYSIE